MSEIRITGVYVQYYFVCKRKLWLFSKHIKMEAQVMQLKCELKELIRADKDSIIFFSSREEKWLNKDVMGLNKNAFSNLL